MKRGRIRRAFLRPTLAGLLYIAVVASPGLWTAIFTRLFAQERRVLYAQTSMLEMVGQHLGMVALSSVLSVLIGVSLGIFVTRPSGADFHDVISDLANLGQTFPPVAVLTLSVPLLGFGFEPTIFALTVYGVLPVLVNTIEGLNSVPDSVSESARAMGMRPMQILWRAELPVAAPVIFAGVRISVVVNVATATIGAAIGAGGIGAAIISGLVNDDPAVTLQGGLLAAGLALVLDGLLVAAERSFGRTAGTRAAAVAAPRV